MAVAMMSCTPTIRTLAAVDVALFACDATQTYSASGHGSWDNGLHEGDPINGTKPSTSRIYGLMAINIAVASAIVIAPLPDWAKAFALVAIGANVAHTVNNNREYVDSCGF